MKFIWCAFFRTLVGLFFVLPMLYVGQSHAKQYVYGILGDAGVRNAATQAVRETLLEQRIRKLIMPGDNIYDYAQSYEFVWDDWKQKGFDFHLVALGNHHIGFAKEMAYFGMPAEFYKLEEEPGFRFLVLNSENQSNVTEQIAWLKHELEISKSTDLVFVMFHHPTFTVSTRHNWTERRAFQTEIRKLLQVFSDRIDALIFGHDHMASFLTINQTPTIVSGAAFEQFIFAPVNYVDNGFQVQTKWMYEGDPSWVRLDVETSTKEVWLNYFNAKKRQVDCSIRIHPLPLLMRPNCGSRRVGW